MRKPLTQAETDALNSLLERQAIRLEQNNKLKEAQTLRGVLAALRDEPRDE
jgi:hypothetical protein